ncbi:MAG: MFS transporter [Gammaproteobacteria bacterium]|nr:MFS transporter [Gammaproteobacteria bacterium]
MIHLTLVLTYLNFVGANAARVVLTLFALELGAPAYAVGLIGGLLYLFPLLLSWPIGALADRYGSRGLLIFGTVCGAASLMLPYFVPTLPALYVAASLNGLGLAFFHVTMQNLIGTLSRPEERARNFSNFSLAGSITNFVGPLVAGVAIDSAGHAVACLVTAAQPVIGVVLLLIWGRRYPPGNPNAVHGPGVLVALKDTGIWRMLAVGGLVQLGQDLFQFYLPIYGHSIGLSASAIGAILASSAVAAFVVRMFLAYLVKRFPAETLLAWVFLAGTVGFALAPFFTHVTVLMGIAFLFGLGMGMGVPLTVILMFARSAEGRSGQTLGVRLTVNNFVRMSGPVVFGAIATALGLAPVFWISAAMMAGGGWLSWTGRKRPVQESKAEGGRRKAEGGG